MKSVVVLHQDESAERRGVLKSECASPTAEGTPTIDNSTADHRACVVLLPSCETAGLAAEADQPRRSLPTVMLRDDRERTTVHAIPLNTPLKIDGILDEAIYLSTAGITAFIQQLPKEGSQPSERTEAWVFFDQKNIYVAARCWDSAPPEEWIANEMRRDSPQVGDNDTFGVLFDTFFDGRNGSIFVTNPLGARVDSLMTDEGNVNVEWNPVWDVQAGRFDGGWSLEMEIPFKSLRYVSGEAQIWGI